MPKTYKFLIDESIKVISARSDFEKKFPGETRRWKREAFVEISKRYSYSVCVADLRCPQISCAWAILISKWKRLSSSKSRNASDQVCFAPSPL